MGDEHDEESVCEHCYGVTEPNRRFCSRACARCEYESRSEETGCDGICIGAEASHG